MPLAIVKPSIFLCKLVTMLTMSLEGLAGLLSPIFAIHIPLIIRIRPYPQML